MAKKVSISEIQAKLYKLNPKLSLDESTFINTTYPANFKYERKPDFKSRLHNVLNGHGNHPLDRAIHYRLNIDELESRLKKLNPLISIDKATYKGRHKICKFHYEGKEDYWALPHNILNGHIYHPSTSIERIQVTNLKKYGFKCSSKSNSVKKKIKSTCLLKYGVENSFQSEIIKAKIKATNLVKYGYENSSQNAAIALKTAKSSNICQLRLHWKTEEELVCRGSWEAKVIDYLNDHSIDFIWQPMVFKLPNGKVYFPDLYLIKENKYIEIKGYFRDDALYKWKCFHSSYSNSELWNKEKLKSLGIL